MFHSFYKLILVFTINLLISVPLYAKAIEQKKVDFQVRPEELMKGDIHYFFEILSPNKLALSHPEIFELDSLSLIQESNVMMMVTKSVMIVNKPVGFFDDKQLLEDRYVSHVLGDQKVKRLNTDSFRVTVPGEGGYSYKMQSFFDADDVTTLPNSKVVRAVTAAKKLDVIALGASTIQFTEKTNYSKYTEGGVSVSSYIPMKENKTLVISYNVYAVKKAFALPKLLKSNFLSEIGALKALQENFKP